MAFPVILSQIGQITVNQADMIMLGHLGAENIAGISLGNSVFILIIIVGIGIASAITPLIAEADGKNDSKEAGIYFKHAMILNTIISILLMLICFAFIPFFDQLNQPKDAVELAIPYLKIVNFSFIPFMLFFSMKQYADGFSLTKLGMYATLSGNIVNIIMNYILIYGKFGFSEMGIEGAAWGTFISRSFMLIMMIILVIKSNTLLTPIQLSKYSNLEKNRFRNILKLGIPSALQNLFEMGAFSAAAFIAGLVGTIALAAHQVALNLIVITFLMCQGFAVAATVRVGNNLGRNDYSKIRKAGLSALFQVVAFMASCSLLFIVFRNWLPFIYVSEEEVVHIASGLLIIASLFQLSDGSQVVLLGALRGMKDVKIPTLITFMAYWIIALPSSYILAIYYQLGVIGIWISLGVGLSISAILLGWRFHILCKVEG